MLNRNLPSLRRRFDPWSSFDEMRDLINRFTDDFGDLGQLAPSTPTQFVPRVDVRDKGDNYLVTAEIPGMTEKDINISLDENVLTLEGEKKSEFKDEGKGFWRSEISYGSFYRSIPLDQDVDEGKVEASYKDGVLKVTLGKKQGASKKRKKIEISSGKQIQQ